MKYLLIKFFTVSGFIFFTQIIIAQTTVFAKNWGILPSSNDCTPAVVKCLEYCKENNVSKLVFEKGIYHFYPDYGLDKYVFASNNDEGLKRIVFLMEGMKNFTIEGNGADFIFHNMVNPFVVSNCENITFKNFSIDFSRTFHNEVHILDVAEKHMDVYIPENFPYIIKNRILIFVNDKNDKPLQSVLSREYNYSYPYGYLLEYDPIRKETATMARDHYLNNAPLIADDLGDRKVRIHIGGIGARKGNIMLINPLRRDYSAFSVSKSRDMVFRGITMYHAGGMGIVGQRIHNVWVDSCSTKVSNGRAVSCTQDATHFVNCTGKTIISNSDFRNQLDDATNIHGIYVELQKQISEKEFLVQLKHYQQLGFDFLEPGTVVEFVKSKSMTTVGNPAKVIEAKRINKDFTYIKLDKGLPEGIVLGDVIAELRDYPFVHLYNNIIAKNRARGILLNSRGKTIVENNYFHTGGAAILFEGDARYWYEQGGVNDCTIRNNIFDNCMYGVWRNAIIGVGTAITEDKEVSRYQKNIKIYDNEFRVFDGVYLLDAFSVENLDWYNNKVTLNNEYEPLRQNNTRFNINFSDNIRIKE